MKSSVNILGTEYKIERHKVSEDETLEKNHFAGYCDEEEKLIVFGDVSEDKHFDMSEQAKKTFEKKVLRHEIIHAFFNESGLSDDSNNVTAWAKNEEMVDWFAIQSPKVFKVFQELDIL